MSFNISGSVLFSASGVASVFYCNWFGVFHCHSKCSAIYSCHSKWSGVLCCHSKWSHPTTTCLPYHPTHLTQQPYPSYPATLLVLPSQPTRLSHPPYPSYPDTLLVLLSHPVSCPATLPVLLSHTTVTTQFDLFHFALSYFASYQIALIKFFRLVH